MFKERTAAFISETKQRLDTSEKKIERMDRKVDEGFNTLEKKI